MDQKFGQATRQKLNYLAQRSLEEADAGTRAVMNDMARGATEAQILELSTSLSKSHGRTEAYLHIQREFGEKAVERERKKEAEEFLDGLRPTMAGRTTGGAAESEEQRALDEKSAAMDEELASAHVNAQPMDQGGVTLTDEQILGLPPVRNVADAFVSPLCYKLWAANKKEQQAWVDTNTADWVKASELPSGVKPVDIVFVGHAKPKTGGGVDKFKVRWPLNGQPFERHVQFAIDPFAATPGQVSVRSFFAMAAGNLDRNGEPPTKADVRGAFLETEVCPVHGAVYARVPAAMAFAELMRAFHKVGEPTHGTLVTPTM